MSEDKDKILMNLKGLIWKTIMATPNLTEHDIHLLITWLQDKKVQYHMEKSHPYKNG